MSALSLGALAFVCDIAREECAVWLQAGARLHWSIPDPVSVADAEERIGLFRTVRDELRQRVEGLLQLIPRLTSR